MGGRGRLETKGRPKGEGGRNEEREKRMEGGREEGKEESNGFQLSKESIKNTCRLHDHE